MNETVITKSENLGHRTRRLGIRETFWERVKKGSDSECWPYQGTIGNKGYGKTWLNGRNVTSSRVAWILTNGEILDGLHVLHKCDNPACCNPSHLFIGTHTDNMRDMFAKNRCKRHKGENHSMAKLSDSQAVEIRELYVPRFNRARGTEYISRQAIAKKFSVSESTIKDVLSGRHFSHV